MAEGRPRIPVAMAADGIEAPLEERLLSMGVADYIRKPVRNEVLLMRLRNAVRNRPAPSRGHP